MPRVRIDDWIGDDKLLTLKGWARDGLTDIEIANNMGISVRTFYNWVKKEVRIMQAIKKGREPLIVEVEDAFIKECFGYWVTETKTIEKDDGSIETQKTEKYMRPVTASQIFFLKNKKPERWKEKQEIKSEVDVSASESKVTIFLPENNRDNGV